MSERHFGAVLELIPSLRIPKTLPGRATGIGTSCLAEPPEAAVRSDEPEGAQGQNGPSGRPVLPPKAGSGGIEVDERQL